MPELVEQMYCSQQIVIPPKFPYILKRYCKAAIKTQPYDLLRWSYEYFKALSQRREPPVKLRLEYPVFSTEGGLTRGCLKVLANQLGGMDVVPLPAIRAAWQGFCLDVNEMKRILCLCEVYARREKVPFLHFIAVAGGLLTKCLTHTMILLCETLTKEPDGGSAGISVHDFLLMYKFLAAMDASKNVKYINGFREGDEPPPPVEEEEEIGGEEESTASTISDDYWEDKTDLMKLTLINDRVPMTAGFSVKMDLPVIGKIERSPSVERAGQIERENYLRERKGRATSSLKIDEQLRHISAQKMGNLNETTQDEATPDEAKGAEKKEGDVEIYVYDEDDNLIPFEFYGEPIEREYAGEEEEETFEGDPPMVSVTTVTPSNKSTTAAAAKSTTAAAAKSMTATTAKSTTAAAAKSTTAATAKSTTGGETEEAAEAELADSICALKQEKDERLEDLERTFDEIAAIVDRFKSANYDLGMVAGRQMSTTSGEFIVQHIEREIMDVINEQIAILPDPDLKKKKAKPEEVAMIRNLLETFLDENMEIIIPEEEEVEEEETPIPDIIQVYAVPGIGPPVDEDLISDFISYAMEVTKVQSEIFMPRNIRHFMCPPLEKHHEYKYDEGKPKKEEVASGGNFTE